MASYTNTSTFAGIFFANIGQPPKPEQIQEAAVMAYNEINARLNGIYDVPFTAVPGYVLDISNLFTKCLAMKIAAGSTPAIPRNVKNDQSGDSCTEAAKKLDALVNLTVTLPGVAILTGASGVHTRAGFPPVFDMDDSLNHQPSRRLIDKIETERDV
jgi:hypothetical protein